MEFREDNFTFLINFLLQVILKIQSSTECGKHAPDVSENGFSESFTSDCRTLVACIQSLFEEAGKDT